MSCWEMNLDCKVLDPTFLGHGIQFQFSHSDRFITSNLYNSLSVEHLRY
jgi:hypothetical protein